MCILEDLALHIGLIQQTLSPALKHPQNIIFAADHGSVEEGVSLSPKEITWQQISYFLLGAAGGMEAIVTALSVQNDFVHKTINYTTPDPECDLDYCVEGNREMPVYAALSYSLGFGGHNATICIKKCD